MINDIFDGVTSCSIFDDYILSEIIFLHLVIKLTICVKLYALLFTSLKQTKSVRFL